MTITRRCAFSVFGCAFLISTAEAQTYPAKPVRIVVGFPPGSGTDIVARVAAQKLAELLGQQMIVDNRPGAGANIAADAVAKAAPDGYTLLVAQNALAISPALYRNLPYDAMRDLTAVGGIAAAPHILLVHRSLPVNSVKDLIALAKRRPGELNYASSGVGINDHMCGELLRALTGINVVHVPYKGGNLAVADVVNGQITYFFAGMPVGLPMHKSGRLKGLAVTSKDRYKGVPELPTVAESGVPDYEVVLWQALFAPAATPPAVIARVSDELGRARQSPDMRDWLANSGVEVFESDATQFGTFFRREIAKWGKVIKDAGLKAE